MDTKTTIQLVEYPGAQKSALWGMNDLFNYADGLAEEAGGVGFKSEITTNPETPSDIIIFPPALSNEPSALPNGWREVLSTRHKSGSVLASVCSGAFLLAETGLLDGRRVTTHWRHAATFHTMYPDVIIDTDRLLVDGGDIVTAGGVMAWTDLALHLIQRYGSRHLMLDVARMFVLDPPEREQSYYATFEPIRNHGDKEIATAQAILEEQPNLSHSLASLAKSVMISERSLQRRFKQATGLTPVTYLQHLRVEMARTLLEITRDSFEQISWKVGYSDPAAFRRVFQRIIGLSPSAYRQRFGLGKDVQVT